MSRPCPNCGTTCAIEARFCRLCGTPLKPAVSGGEPVSPGANTAPLTDDGRTTHGLSTEDGSASAPETARVRRAEMESILRRPAPAPSSQREANNAQAFTDNEATAVPVTTALAAGADSQRVREDSATVQTVAAKGVQAEKAVKVDGAATESQVVKPSAAKRKDSRTRRTLQLAVLALVALAAGLGALAFYYSRNAGTSDPGGTAPVSTNDQRRVVAEKLSEAETLLAEGKTAEAISRLRSAIRLEPSNSRAHRLLAEALERTGAVNEAIDEYRAAAQNDPGNEETLLRYADALRRVGRTEEASEIYQKLSSSSSVEVARLAKEQLGATSQTASNNAGTRDANSPDSNEETVENTETTSRPASSSSSTRTGASTASANGSGGGAPGAARPKNDPVTSYTTAMKIIEGKDIRKMNRAELIRAYELFQYAQSGPNAADANRRLRELDKELFERRKRKQ